MSSLQQNPLADKTVPGESPATVPTESGSLAPPGRRLLLATSHPPDRVSSEPHWNRVERTSVDIVLFLFGMVLLRPLFARIARPRYIERTLADALLIVLWVLGIAYCFFWVGTLFRRLGLNDEQPVEVKLNKARATPHLFPRS